MCNTRILYLVVNHDYNIQSGFSVKKGEVVRIVENKVQSGKVISTGLTLYSHFRKSIGMPTN